MTTAGCPNALVRATSRPFYTGNSPYISSQGGSGKQSKVKRKKERNTNQHSRSEFPLRGRRLSSLKGERRGYSDILMAQSVSVKNAHDLRGQPGCPTTWACGPDKTRFHVSFATLAWALGSHKSAS
ncbi:uncharacterized protein SPSK_10038 [Sporothrix schenckii 1099-18]|uniref:Uncharacterized protein n=1 Tax=Sporothrix schenckii 1099-18 TaxID=1397361 RepID=A0A0F2M6X3_SPOSC|nr:uncharacterized protein SPSK_10038 [Sporothrix schenckii 1099-18]KJR85392.1 hypothetical protein SPSK_10038 [Sporothrix schenckii 1099-18]